MKISLRAARVNAGYTQKEVADMLGCSVNSILQWENGLVQVKKMHVIALASIYSISVDDFDLTTNKSKRCTRIAAQKIKGGIHNEQPSKNRKQ